MSKSMYIMNTPKSCNECRFNYEEDWCEICILANRATFTYCKTDTKPDWCPLKQVPDRIDLNQYVDNTSCGLDSIVAYQYAQGWNNCIDKILEEKE